jgi:hypothetical protein
MSTARKPHFNPTFGGHAPGYLRDALTEALDSFDQPWWSNVDLVFFNADQRQRWEAMPTTERSRWLIGQLWNCTDIVPGHLCAGWGLPSGTTYASLVRALRQSLIGV